MKRLITTLLLALLIPVLSSCTGNLLQSKVTPSQVYVLRNIETTTAKTSLPIQLSIALPTTAPGLDTNRIAVLRNRNQLDYFAAARWSGTPPQVLQAYLVDYLQSQHGYKSVIAETGQTDTDYLIKIDIREFQTEYSDSSTIPIIHVAWSTTVFNIKTRKAITTLQSTSRVPADENRLSAVINAFQLATQNACSTLSEQLATAFNQALAKQ